MEKGRKAGTILAVGIWCILALYGCQGISAPEWIGGKEPQSSYLAQDKVGSPKAQADSVTVQQGQFSGSGEEQTEQVKSISKGKFAYECLSEEGKMAYDQMLEAILSYQKSVKLATRDKDLMQKAYQALNCDYGGLFWVEGYVFTSYTKGKELVGLEFSPNYIMDEEEKNELQKQVDAVVEEWLAGISLHDSDYEKAKYVFETLIERVDYVEDSKDNQNILSVFLHQKTVCQGYACATQYLLRQLGISSTIVSGRANNQAHAWNIVKLDEKYYHMDTTWGNSTYLDTEQQKAKFVNYNFLCMTDQEIFYTHQVETFFPLPDCSSMEHNYYVEEGRYFEIWDPEAIGDVFRKAWENGEAFVDVKCRDEELYGQLKEYFVHQQKISDYCDGMEYVYYMESPEYGVFTVNFNEM